jgi:hypothetical protein
VYCALPPSSDNNKAPLSKFGGAIHPVKQKKIIVIYIITENTVK